MYHWDKKKHKMTATTKTVTTGGKTKIINLVVIGLASTKKLLFTLIQVERQLIKRLYKAV